MALVVIWDNGMFIIYCLFYLNICSSCAAVYCMQILGVGQSSAFAPRKKDTGVFGIYLNALYPIVGSF